MSETPKQQEPIVSIKSEFKRQRMDDEGKEKSDTPGATAEAPDSRQKKKKFRGQNKHRFIKKSYDKVNLCFATAQGVHCKNELCKKEHDLSLYLVPCYGNSRKVANPILASFALFLNFWGSVALDSSADLLEHIHWMGNRLLARNLVNLSRILFLTILGK
jgi:hypothetical protein